MIAYNKTWLDNLAIQEKVNEELHYGNLTKEEAAAITAKYPVGFYTPNVFIRIGLFLLTVVIVLLSLGLFALMMQDVIERSIGGLVIFFGVATYVALEAIASSKHHYASGVVEALLYISLSLLYGGIFYIIEPSGITASLLALLLAFVGIIRFSDSLLSIVAFIAAGSCIVAAVEYITFLQPLLPFMLMLFSALCYFLFSRFATLRTVRHYQHCLQIMRIVSLLLFYASSNYFIVKEAGNELFGMELSFGWFFWITTVIIPPAYLVWGIIRKDALLIRTGLILLAAIVFTIRQYYAIMPLEIAMTIAGAALMLIAYWFIRYLKIPRHGFTYEELYQKENALNVQVESLVIAETFSPAATPETDTRFGGGSFGGGGASGDF